MQGAVALGFFDGVHLGHRSVLQHTVDFARTHSMKPCAFTFATDSLPVKQGSSIEYLYREEQKEKLLYNCGMEELYCPKFQQLCDLDGRTFCRQVLKERFHAGAVFCGNDFRFGKRAAWEFQDLVRFGYEMNFQVICVDAVRLGTEKISSTLIRQTLKDGDVVGAKRMLGQPYYISGRVQHGKALGKTQGVPTINLPFAQGQLVPKYGVYISQTRTPQGRFPSVTNIGLNPTVEERKVAVAETYILDFDGDLYDQPCTIELLQFLRPERKFPTQRELFAQIKADSEAARIWHRKER